MNRRFFLSIFIMTLLLSCGNDVSSDDAGSEEKGIQKNPITAKAIDDFEFKDYILSTDGETEVVDWEKYQELSIQVNYLRKADLSFFNGDRELLKKFMDAFRIQLPVNLNTRPISSRMVVVETSVLRLYDNLTLDNIDDQDKLDSIKEVLVAFSNLNYQINKKLERDKYDKISSEY